MAEASDPVVIVSAVRSPLGRFMGELSPLPRTQARIACDRRGTGACQACAGEGRRGLHGLRASRRPGPGPGAPGCACRRPARCHRRDHRQQGLRLRHEGDHAGARHHSRRLGRDRRLRRHGKHEQRAVSARQGARRLSRRPRPHHRPHDDGRARRRLRDRPLHGRFRRGHRRSLSVHPQGPGRLCDGNVEPRAQSRRWRRVQGRDRADHADREGRPPHRRQ